MDQLGRVTDSCNRELLSCHWLTNDFDLPEKLLLHDGCFGRETHSLISVNSSDAKISLKIIDFASLGGFSSRVTAVSSKTAIKVSCWLNLFN